METPDTYWMVFVEGNDRPVGMLKEGGEAVDKFIESYKKFNPSQSEATFLSEMYVKQVQQPKVN